MNLASKVQSSRISEQDYRKLRERMSYTSLKRFGEDRESFYKEYILGEIPKRKETPGLVMGQLVHCLLSGIEGDFDIKFHIASAKTPKPQMLKLCENLYTRSLQSINEFDEQQDSFKIIFSDAVQKTKYNFNGEEVEFKGKDEEKVLSLFDGSDAELYYKEMLETRNKIMVSIAQIEQAERLVQKIKENSITEKYVNTQSIWVDKVRDIKALEIFSEVPIMFDVKVDENDEEGVQYKCLPDKLEIDHINKVIQPIDWKCSSWDNESPDYAYIKYGYYIQAALYDLGIEKWAAEHGLANYRREPMRFVFIDVTGFNNPCIVVLSQDDLDRAKRGFKIRGIRYRGMYELMTELSWHLSTGIWNTSKSLHDSKGIMKLQLAYGNRG